MPRLIDYAKVAIRDVSDLMAEDEVQSAQCEMLRECASYPACWPARREERQVFLGWDEVCVANIGFQAGVAYIRQDVRIAEHPGEDCGYQGDGSEMDTDEVDVLFSHACEAANFCSVDDPEFQPSARLFVMTFGSQPCEVCEVANGVLEQVLVKVVRDNGFVV